MNHDPTSQASTGSRPAPAKDAVQTTGTTPDEQAREREFARLADQVGLQLRLGRVELASAAAQELLAGWPDSTSAHELAGDVAAAQGKVALARQRYREAMRLEPANVDAERKYGLALVTQSPEERRQALIEGVIADPSGHAGRVRKPLNAVLNAVLFPGLGQLYNRQHEKGLAMVAGAALALICLLYVLMPYASAMFTLRRAGAAVRDRVQGAEGVVNSMGAGGWILVGLAVAVYVALYFWGIYDAWRQAQSEEEQMLGVR